MSRPRNKDWTKQRFEEFKDVILPSSMTVTQALRRAERKWNSGPLSISSVHRTFTRAGAKSPSHYLWKENKELSDSAPEFSDAGEVEILRRRIKVLEAELDAERQEAKVAAMIKTFLHGSAEREVIPPSWTYSPQKKKSNVFHGVPTLFMSDIHHGECVDPDQVDGCNNFNPEVSRKRIQRTFDRATYLLNDVLGGSGYPGIVLALGGDMVSGTIHEELNETNELPIFQAVLDLVDHIAAGIQQLRHHFGRVFIPCVVGNHGRLSRKPKAKNGPHDNYEYILYHMLARYFRSDPNITILIPDSFTCHYRIYGTRYLLTHGDQFRGGSGIAGPQTPWALGDFRLRKQMASIEKWTGRPTEYDVLLFGHWHKYFPTPSFIVNGSLKGMDEYAKKQGYDFESPKQALWLTTPDRGITFAAPVFAEDPPKERAKDSWLSILTK